jgi:hypothetical protein
MSDTRPKRGFSGAVLRLLSAGDYRLTVTGRREFTIKAQAYWSA